MKRLFTFGCSYTSYSWPTWANLLSIDYDEFYNWGLAGLGNRAIAERVMEAHQRHTFTKDDLIIIQWSSHLRNDWFHEHAMPERRSNWKTAGSIFNYLNQSLYDQKWVETFFYEPAYLMHTLNNIGLTQGFLKSTGCKWYMTSIGDIRNMGEDFRDVPGSGEKHVASIPYTPQGEFAWNKMPGLKIYEQKIWKDHADHWLAPIEPVANQHLDLTFEFDDTNAPGDKFFDVHPSPHQTIIWIEQELKDKLELTDASITAFKELADSIHNLQKRMKFDKITFELTLAKRIDWPSSTSNMVWPSWANGF
jgi:hypothetical protein